MLIIDCQALHGVQSSEPDTWDKDETPDDADKIRGELAGQKKHGFDWADSFGDTESMFRTIKQLGYKTVLSSALQGAGLYNWPSYDPTVEANLDKYWAAIVVASG
ncbi:MAG: hypothetical protein ACYS76_14850 [Planctomycetota bacterium]